jgi:hypothetical protein
VFVKTFEAMKENDSVSVGLKRRFGNIILRSDKPYEKLYPSRHRALNDVALQI